MIASLIKWTTSLIASLIRWTTSLIASRIRWTTSLIASDRPSYVSACVPDCVPYQVVIGNEHDTSTSSYLLNIFTDEEVGAYIDIDASQCGNEARFVNDFHGTGADGPNAPARSSPWALLACKCSARRLSLSPQVRMRNSGRTLTAPLARSECL